MNYLSKFIYLTFVVFICNTTTSFASHIIGGEMTYTCLGNNNYEIRMTIFRDCASINNVGGNTDFDNQVSIGIFSGQGNYLSRIIIPFIRPAQTLNLGLISPCYSIPQDVCVQTYTYVRQVYLPYRIGGYHLAYQRCCRNAGIINIINPDATGATYDVRITQEALSYCDSSPRFKEWPPFYVCVNTPINHDHSAFDLDGDSIAYRLCDPFLGADVVNPAPSIPSSPPFQSVFWKMPYHVNNMMGGTDPLRIDPVTGRLTGTPPNIGNFVIGVCAIEYRNGVEIGRTKRDFQYLVRGNCTKRTSANFVAKVPACNTTLSVLHANMSAAGNTSYSWDFGDNSPIVTGLNPTHTYPDTGSYLVELTGFPCADTIQKMIYVNLDGVAISLEPKEACKGDTVELIALNTSLHNHSIISYNWTPSSFLTSGQGTDTALFLADNSIFTVSVQVINDKGCTDTKYTKIRVERLEASFDSIAFNCNTSLDVSFSNKSIGTNNFLWDFGGTGTSTEASPKHSFPDTGVYAVSLMIGLGGLCQDTLVREIELRIDGVEITASDSQMVCRGDTVLLVATNLLASYTDGTSYTWTPESNILTGQGTDSVEVYANGDIKFYVVGFNSRGCRDTATASVNVTTMTPALAVLANPDSIFVGQTAQLYATNLLGYDYLWTANPTLSAVTIPNPEAKPRETTTYYISVTNDYCSIDDSVTVFIKEPICGNPVVFVPNAFSPDGDGYNDVLLVNGNNITQLTMAIYNRWGQKIFETNDQNIGWDGTFKGQVLPPDVYGYYMQCQCDDGSSLSLKGNITLLK